MTTIEQLQRIKTKCEQLLAIAEKRTPGKWTAWTSIHNGERMPARIRSDSYKQMAFVNSSDETAKFIASCAGSAEAGWRSTIVAIDMILCLPAQVLTPEELSDTKAVKYLLSAWPEELLN